MTKKVITKKALSILIAGVLGYPIVGYADDTEIYFSDNKAVKPNVLFILDLSGSMRQNSVNDGWTYSINQPRRIDVLKSALEQVVNDKDIKNLRMGVMTFNTNSVGDQILIPQPIIDIDEIDPSKAMSVTDATDGSNNKVLHQRITVKVNNGYQRSIETNRDAPYDALSEYQPYRETAVLGQMDVSLNNNLIGYRFENLLIKKPTEVGLSPSAITNASLILTNVLNVDQSISLILNIEDTDDALYFKPFLNNISDRIPKISPQNVRCPLPIPITSGAKITCDVTGLIRNQVSRAGWKEGQAISLIATVVNPSATRLVIYLKDKDQPATTDPQLAITLNPKLIAENHAKKGKRILDTSMNFKAISDDPLVHAMFMASQYISNIPWSGAVGPFHLAGRLGDKTASELVSPLTNDCQLSHLVIMSDGNPVTSINKSVYAPYLGAGDQCRIFINRGENPAEWKNEYKLDPGTGGQTCGRAVASWMARTSHSSAQSSTTVKGGNYVYTHTVGFSLTDGRAKQFLKELAEAGMGLSFEAKGIKQLSEAFKKVVVNAMIVTKPSAAGQVVLGPQSGYDQRHEVFYGLFKVEATDYWPGNVKGYKIAFKERTLSNGKKVRQAVLKDWDANQNAIDEGGKFLNVKTAWSTGTADGTDMTLGGTVGQLPNDPSSRNLYTISASGDKISLEANSAVAIDNNMMGLTGEDATDGRRRGLLNFIRGYQYADGGSTTPQTKKKLGDSANNGITLVSYGCDDNGKKVTECDFNSLRSVGLVATNDGFLRGIDLRNGKALYEFMPKEMLPIINKLQKQSSLSRDLVRTYGLDNKVVVYHDDQNEDGYINKGEKAYAILTAGRGGKFLYIIDISNMSSPNIIKAITNQDSGFSQLGYTWSTPEVGNVKIGTDTIPVAIFGGGYDPSQDTDPAQNTDTMGNTVYMINLNTGNKIWSATGMTYSVPGAPGIVIDQKTKLITDIFIGDMGGQLWRFKVNNGSATLSSLVTPAGGINGMVAQISGTSADETRRFYQKPMIYLPKKASYLTVNLGTGYRAHPLVKNNQDRFYSFRFPVKVNPADSSVISESQLGVAIPGNTSSSVSPIDKGFMIKLATETARKGEKVISNAFADVDRLIFNTYIPDTEKSQSSCYPSVGTQRTYYFDITNGKSLLETGYTEITPSTLPLDVTAYCDKGFCTIIGSVNDFANDDLPEVNIFEINKKQAAVIKTTWTDIFDPSVQ